MVLKHLNKEILSGYDLMRYLDMSGNKSSPGYIYPLLKDLQRNTFISVKKEGRRKIYSITQKGKKLLEDLENKNREMMEIMAGIRDKREVKEFIKLKSHMMGKNGFSLQDIEKLKKLNKLIFSFYKDKNYEKREKMIKVLENTTKRLEKLK